MASAKHNTVTYWQLYERAAKAQYGEDIEVVWTADNEKEVNNIPFEVSLVDMEDEPREVKRT